MGFGLNHVNLPIFDFFDFPQMRISLASTEGPVTHISPATWALLTGQLCHRLLGGPQKTDLSQQRIWAGRLEFPFLLLLKTSAGRGGCQAVQSPQPHATAWASPPNPPRALLRLLKRQMRVRYRRQVIRTANRGLGLTIPILRMERQARRILGGVGKDITLTPLLAVVLGAFSLPHCEDYLST